MAPQRGSQQSSSNSTTSSGKTPPSQKKHHKLFPIVGIGASAGGLAAFTELLQNIPNDTGMGFVLIQHLAPNHKSFLTEILAKTTQMPVTEVEEGMLVEPNHFYVIPPNTNMIISGGVLKLTPRADTIGKYLPIDALFISLASDRSNKAIAVVLSGKDGDGTIGIEVIKAAGGITFAQCTKSAKFDSMPHKAAATGSVDFILTPQEIALELANISKHPYIVHSQPEKIFLQVPQNQDNFQTILDLLQQTTGVNFSNYKEQTLRRRLMRRLVLHKLSTLEDYIKYIQENPAELSVLFEDILIKVSNFFRNPYLFEALKNNIFSRIKLNKLAREPIRIWVAGCATGEEAYSLAICLVEFLEKEGQKEQENSSAQIPNTQHSPQKAISKPLSYIPQIKIFATDISDVAIDKARKGIYTERQMADVSPERLERFFVEVEGGYQICKNIRELCIFAKQNLYQDPPFFNLDLVSCRNVLIYFTPALQKQVLQIFHYSINEKGFLVLGSSESPGETSELFAPVDKRCKIYTKKLLSTKLKFDFVSKKYPPDKMTVGKKINSDATSSNIIQQETDRIILEKYGSSSVVINNDLDIILFRGDTSLYLRPAPGKPNSNILKMAREGLILDLRTAIYNAQNQKISVKKLGLQIKDKNNYKTCNIEVIPFSIKSPEECYFLVIFEEVNLASPRLVPGQLTSPQTGGLTQQATQNYEIIQLKQELAIAKEDLSATKEYLQSIIEEQELTNQELKAANEEIQSSNEELQGTNEELETAKEELQATNEELNTINDELRHHNLEASQLNNDLMNLLSNVNLPIIMLDKDLCIRRFTPKADEILNLLPTDIGRPLNNIKLNINVPNLAKLVLQVIKTSTVIEQEVQDLKSHWYNLRILPYITSENSLDGAVLILIDIDVIKRSAEQLKAARNYSEGIVNTVRQPLLVINANLRIITANIAFYKTFEVTPNQVEQELFTEIQKGVWNLPELQRELSKVISENQGLIDFEISHEFEKLRFKTMLLNAWAISQSPEDNTLMLLAITDITERKQFEIERTKLLAHEQAVRASAEAANRAKDEFLSVLSHELRTPLSAIIMWVQLLASRQYEDPTLVRGLEMIERSAKAQNQLIEELLDISRITAGKLNLICSEVDLITVIEAAIEMVLLTAEAKNIQLESIVNYSEVIVFADFQRLQQVLWNLLANAIKFTPEGGRVTVELEIIESLAQIQIIDTGIGISAEFLSYVFERFLQADSSNTRSHGGLGLGLTIVRRLVELHNGTVEASSPGAGQGTTITVRLPLITYFEEPLVLSNGNLLAMSKLASPALAEIETLSGLHVLLVDDNADTLDVLKTILEEYQAEVTAVSSAKLAMEALRANPKMYDVLLSDLAMPKEDGYTLIHQVRALEPGLGGQIPAASLTAYITSNQAIDALNAGYQVHLTKPVEPAQLAFVVATLAERTS
ncbi:signal transduction histidine kinase with CheB and CheR activity [Crinalium epipsammum PCC 9333]|uniref:Circadian input-output histidine kinase CikA n=1 Tax=Crinalium epipsammum PCC 9333 TaxID=1173022 RepID=K9W5F7_9CYAN|nr:chemotaxis protein CheB [Crinalium epipsammum]AFZ14992.1 signal transduction histidine kinase with CheB and CheR activity [Crinalium epipsammum PCC 9333]